MYKPCGLVLRVSTTAIADSSLLFPVSLETGGETNDGGSRWPGNEEKMCIIGGKDAHIPFLDLFPSLYRDTIVYIPGNIHVPRSRSNVCLGMIFSRMIPVLDGNGGSVFHRRWDSFVDRYAPSFWLGGNGKEMRKCTKQTWMFAQLGPLVLPVVVSDFIRCLPLTVNGRKNLKEQLVSNLYSLYRGNDRFKGTTSRNM